MKERRKFSRSFKLAAVKKVVEQGMSGADVARELGIEGNLIYNWKAKFEREGVLKDAYSASPEEENKRLRERVRQLEMERDILKKVAPRSLGKGNSHALMI